MGFRPSYLKLYETGELSRRAEKAKSLLQSCSVCPHQCGVDRTTGGRGICNCGDRLLVASICDHHGEEPAISGNRGSGTVFLAQCNMHCLYCQNWQISQPEGPAECWEMSSETLAGKIVELQDCRQVHNISFVSPSSWVPQILEVINSAAEMGLKLPLVYNTNGYDSVESLELLDGVIDIYLPDLKYGENPIDDFGTRFSSAPDYAARSREAVSEMWRQVGKVIVSDDGILKRGLLIRHLVLPHSIAGTKDTLDWIKRVIGTDVWISLMSQYYPTPKAPKGLERPITRKEYDDAVSVLETLGFTQGYVQPFETRASEYYRPDFKQPHPFQW